MRNKPLKYLITTLLLIWLAGLYQDKMPEGPQGFLWGESAEVAAGPIIISEKRKRHILYGNGRGGGHRYGAGVPCKSEFPESWNDEKIIAVTKKVAANDTLVWEQGDNGYYVGETLEDGVKIRVVLGPEKRRVITSYPTNMPRNPCPANDR